MLKSIYCKTRIRYVHRGIINLAIFSSLCFCISNAFGQSTTIVFKTKENAILSISKEIDNVFTDIVIDECRTDAAGGYTYKWNVNDFQFVTCTFHDGSKTSFPIKEGSNLTITYKGDRPIEFTGAGSAEIEFYTKSYKKYIVQPYLNSLFGFPAKANFDELSLLIERSVSALSNALDSLVAEKAISVEFTDYMKNDYNILISCTGVGLYRTRYLENTSTKVNKVDSIKVEKIIDGILEKLSPMIDSGSILKYSSGSSALAVFYTNKFRHLDEKDKEQLLSKHTWVKYLKPHMLGCLVAPEEMQCKYLSLQLLSNYNAAVTKGNSDLFEYISEIRPQNAFLPYLIAKRDELLAAMNADHSGVKYIEDTINTLKDLSQVKEFDQKILYIDMWATWCAPCIAEFKHKDKLQELLSSYGNIIPIYISLDEDKNDMIWREKAKIFNLNGYHLRANEKLTADIFEKLFKEEGVMGVPHYILLDKDGNILERNLNRPGNIDKLKQELDKHFD